MDVPLLPTTVVGSWPVPEWLERLKTDYFRGRISRTQLDEVHDCAVKASIKDQELAGIDIVSDGELRRDNDIDYLLARIPGVEIPVTTKDFYYDYYDVRAPAPLTAPAAAAGLGLERDFAFTRAHTDRPVKFSFTGPFSLSRRVSGHTYGNPDDLVRAIAHVLGGAAHALADAGAQLLQIDEPFLAGYPDQVALAVEAINIVTRDVDVTWALHVCYGNRYARPLWQGHYDVLFPTVLDARVDQLVLEFARKGYEDLPVIQRCGWDRALGIGVVDVKSVAVETPELVASRIRRALDLVPADRLVVNPDCGLRNLPQAVATAKLHAMVEGAALVRDTLPTPVRTAARSPQEPVANPPDSASANGHGHRPPGDPGASVDATPAAPSHDLSTTRGAL